eukprot:TRINITY_DN7185_c0_g2_i5.p1 TRINITY_DN7185_c0_g2~~TRINITY_DN7185_c0_g2_i5.p1  ORF type:complete len:512 (-),score=86.69 TRINITY_DN7185_c0_g2_i5:4149-5684(-)
MFARRFSNSSSIRSSDAGSGSEEDEIVPTFGKKKGYSKQVAQQGGLRQQYQQAVAVRPVSAKSWGQSKTSTLKTYNNDLYEQQSNCTPGDVLGGKCEDSNTDSSRPDSSQSNSNMTNPMQHIRRLQSQKSLAAQKRAERLAGGLVSVNSNTLYNNRNVSIRPPSAQSQRPASQQSQRPGLTQQNISNISRVSSGMTEQSVLETSSSGALGLEAKMKAHGIKGMYDPNQEGVGEKGDACSVSFSAASHQPVDVSDVRSFLMSPAPKGQMVQCYIVREKTNGGLPRYVLYLEEGGRFLLAARKRRASKTSNYLISLDEQDMERSSGTYLGKVRANFVGTEYTIYDRGYNPSRDPNSEQNPVGATAPRCEFAQVVYEMNMLGTKGPRRMSAIIPKVDRISNERRIFRPEDEKQSCLLDAYRNGNNGDDEVLVLRNKPPRWNEQLQVYCLNFNGRVTHASVKNFQLVSESDMDYTVLQFGKISKDTFTMDFQWPMSPFQAFGICLSSFDNKVACQ